VDLRSAGRATSDAGLRLAASGESQERDAAPRPPIAGADKWGNDRDLAAEIERRSPGTPLARISGGGLACGRWSPDRPQRR